MNGPHTSQSNEEAFLECYQAHSDAIFRYCYYKTTNREVAVDLTQETFTRTWEYLRGDKKIDNIRALLYRIAQNAVIDYYRKKKSLSLEMLAEEGFEPISTDEDMLRAEGYAREVREIIDKLDEKYREPIYMRLVEELSIGEIAKTLGLSENVISVRVHRGIKMLQELYNYES